MDWKEAGKGLLIAALALVVIGALSEFANLRLGYNPIARVSGGLARGLDRVIPRLPATTTTTPTTAGAEGT